MTAVAALQWIENELDQEFSDEDLDLDQESDEEYDDSRSSESETEGVRTSNPQLDLDPNVPGCSNRPQTSAQPSKKQRIDLDTSVANAGRSRNEQESEWEEIGEGLDLPVEAFRFTPRHGPGVLASLFLG